MHRRFCMPISFAMNLFKLISFDYECLIFTHISSNYFVRSSATHSIISGRRAVSSEQKLAYSRH